MFLLRRAQLLKPNEKVQLDILSGGIAELLVKVADGEDAIFCLPSSENSFEPTAHFAIDEVTEKVMMPICSNFCITSHIFYSFTCFATKRRKI